MIITSFYSFLLIILQSYKLFKFMQIFCRRKVTKSGKTKPRIENREG